LCAAYAFKTLALPPVTQVKAIKPAENFFEHAIFHECYDGDPCTISLPGLPDVFGDRIPVRLVGIDAPEIKGQCQTKIDLAMKAKDLLNQKLRQAHVIQIRHTARDYFR